MCISFKSNEYLLTSNDGDGPVYVSHVNLVMDLSQFGKKKDQRLNVLVPQETINSIRLAEDFKEKTKYVGSRSEEV